LERVWDYHARIVECICAERLDEGLALLVEHAQLLRDRVWYAVMNTSTGSFAFGRQHVPCGAAARSRG